MFKCALQKGCVHGSRVRNHQKIIEREIAGIYLKGDGIELSVLMWIANEAHGRDESHDKYEIYSHRLRMWGATYSRGAASDWEAIFALRVHRDVSSGEPTAKASLAADASNSARVRMSVERAVNSADSAVSTLLILLKPFTYDSNTES